jgi:prepilin peptidase CpaA
MIHAYLSLLVLLIFPLLAIVAAVKDLTSYTIPNWISLALIAAFPLGALAAGLSLGAVGLHLAVGAGALVLGMVMFALGWIGGGDAKLFAAAGLWLGWPASLTFLLTTCLAGGALAASLLALRSTPLKTFVAGGPSWVARLAEPGEAVPYGVAIALGALAAFPISTLAAAH